MFEGPRVGLLVVTLAIVAGSHLRAASSEWTLAGPAGGEVRALAMDPTNVLVLHAATPGGLFKSTDGGGTWALRSTGFGVRNLYSVVISKSLPRTLYAGTAYAEVYRSTDDGATWALKSTGLPAPPTGGPTIPVVHLAVHPSNASLVYAALTNTPNPVYKSTDAGESWAPASAGLLGPPVAVPSKLGIDPGSLQTVYLATTNAGVFRTLDGGSTWTQKNNGLPFLQATGLSVHPTAPSTVFVALANRLYWTVSLGESWSGLGTCSSVLNVTAVDPLATQNVYGGISFNAGLCRSTNAGISFAPTGFSGDTVNDILVDPAQEGTLYVGAYSGAFKSTDSGASWSLASAGLLAQSIRSLAVSASQPKTLYATYSQPAQFGAPVQNRNRVFRSTDGGLTFADVTSNLPSTGVFPFNKMSVHPTDPQTVYLGGAFGGVGKTTDGGATWQSASTGLPSAADAVLSHPASASTVFAASSTMRPRKSTDGGATWASANSGVTGAVYVLTGHPTDPSVVWAGGLGVVYRTTDGGAQWTASGPLSAGAQVSAIAVNPQSPAVLYASDFGGVYKSTDAGATWTQINASLPASHRAGVGLALTPSNPSELHYATLAPPAIVYRSVDAGQTWTRSGLEGLVINASTLAAGGGTVYAGTSGGVASRVPSSTVLSIDGRFEVEVDWSTAQGGGQSGKGTAVSTGPLGFARGGIFWFFDAANPEMLVKVLNGCSVNQKYWVFASAGTNVGLNVKVTDTSSGIARSYVNPDLTPALPVQDVAAFTCATGSRADESLSSGSGVAELAPVESHPDREPTRAPDLLSATACVPGSTVLCIDGAVAGDRRFRVEVDWSTVQGGGQGGKGTAVAAAPIGFARGGLFWFFDATNPEMLVKIVEGCSVNSTYWVFASAGTNVGLEVKVTDTATGASKTYPSPDLSPALPIQDVNAFACN